MKKVYKTAFGAILLLFFSCKVEPEMIQYGSDACSFCKMTIVDQQHSAQYVTQKGKQFKFDAIECMVNDLSEKEMGSLAILLVAAYDRPGEMVQAPKATYLISEEIKSPMGANLSAFSAAQTAKEAKDKNGGKIYNWPELLQKFDVE